MIAAWCRTSDWTLFRTLPRYARSSGRYSPATGIPSRPTGTVGRISTRNYFFCRPLTVETGTFTARVNRYYNHVVQTIPTRTPVARRSHASVCPQINISQIEYTTMMDAYLQLQGSSSDANAVSKLLTFTPGQYTKLTLLLASFACWVE